MKLAMAEGDVLATVQRLFVGGVPHNAALGLAVRRFGQGRAVTALPWAPRLVGDPRTGVLHGGAITAAIDATCGAAVFAALRVPTPIATLDLRVDVLRPARPGAEVVCEAACDRVTRHVAFARATVHDGDPDDPVATAAATFMIFRGRGKGGGERSARAWASPAAPVAPTPPPTDETPTRAEALAEALAHARATGDMDPLVAMIPYAAFVGLSAGVQAGERITRLAPAPGNVGNASLPALHGGTLGALLESAALFQILATHEGDALPRTINLTVDYLRSARPVDTLASAEVTRAGRRVATVHARAWQEDRAAPVATAMVHVLLAE